MSDVERCNEEAHWFFAQATKPQLAEFHARMEYIRPWSGSPRWERQRAESLAKFKADTVEARALCDRTFDELMATGEVSEELDAEWSALCQPSVVSPAIANSEIETERRTA